MIAMTAFSSAIYVAFLLPFKSMPLIVGFTEIRPSSLLPVVFGLLFGPAGALGSAIGNLVGDFFGTLSLASVFGFIGNFVFAFIPYKLWGRFGFIKNYDSTPTIDSSKKLIEYGAAVIVSSAACASIIAWGCEALGMVPFAMICAIIMLNNTAMALILGPIFLPLFYKVVKKYGMLWTDIMKEEIKPAAGTPRIYDILIISGSLGALAVGLATSLGIAGQTLLKIGNLSGGAGQISVAASVLPFIAMIFYGFSKL